MKQNSYNLNCIQLFEEGLRSPRRGEISIISQHNKRDCFIADIPLLVDRQFRKHFLLQQDEKILLARDTSAWNSRTEGLIITDKRIIYMPKNDGERSHSHLYSISHDAYSHVSYNSNSIILWSTDETSLSIPKRFFFKPKWKSYDFDDAIQQLARILEKIAQSHPHLAYIANNYAVV